MRPLNSSTEDHSNKIKIVNEKIREREEYEKKLDDMITKNQDWFFPIISAVALGWISLNIEFLKNSHHICERYIILWSIAFCGISIILILANLFISIYFAVKIKEWCKVSIKIRKYSNVFIQYSFILSFVFIILGIIITFVSLI